MMGARPVSLSNSSAACLNLRCERLYCVRLAASRTRAHQLNQSSRAAARTGSGRRWRVVHSQGGRCGIVSSTISTGSTARQRRRLHRRLSLGGLGGHCELSVGVLKDNSWQGHILVRLHVLDTCRRANRVRDEVGSCVHLRVMCPPRRPCST